MGRSSKPLSRGQLAFETLLERDHDDDGHEPAQLPPRGQRNQKKKNGEKGGGRDGGVVVLDQRDLAERRRAAAAASSPAAPPSSSASAFAELQARFPGAPRDLLSDVLLGCSDGVESAAEALHSLGLGGGAGEEERGKEKENGATAAEGAKREEEDEKPPSLPRTPAMLTEGLWGGLPPDVQRLIYARLGPRDAARAALSCREFAARARAARSGPREVEIAPRASLRAIEGQVAAFRGASSVSLGKWCAHLEAFEAGGAAEAAAEAAQAAAQQGRHWQRRQWARSSPSSSSAVSRQVRVADPGDILAAIEGAVMAVARGSSKRRKRRGAEAPSSPASEESSIASDPFYLPTLDDPAAACSSSSPSGGGGSSSSAAAEVEHLTFPRLSYGGAGGSGSCSLPPEHCERLARGGVVRSGGTFLLLPGLRSVRFDDVGAGDGPRGLCRGLCRPAGDLVEESERGETCSLESIAITGAPSLDEESVRALLRSWSSTVVQGEGPASSPSLLSAIDFSRCPLLTFAGAFTWPRLALRDRPRLHSVKSVTLDGCERLERFELGGNGSATFPALERLSLRNCRRLAEITVVGSSQSSLACCKSLVELKVSGCAALRSIAAAAALPNLERLSAAGCANLIELPSRASTALLEANFFGCRSLPSSALECLLGTAGRGGGEGAAAPASNLASLTVNGCISLSRLRVSSPELSQLDASGCRSCAEVELVRCSTEKLRSLRLDGCRELRRLSLPGGGTARGDGEGREVGGGLGFYGVASSSSSSSSSSFSSSAFLDPATTGASGVPDEVAALVAAATAKRRKKKAK